MASTCFSMSVLAPQPMGQTKYQTYSGKNIFEPIQTCKEQWNFDRINLRRDPHCNACSNMLNLRYPAKNIWPSCLVLNVSICKQITWPALSNHAEPKNGNFSTNGLLHRQLLGRALISVDPCSNCNFRLYVEYITYFHALKEVKQTQYTTIYIFTILPTNK